MNDQGQSMSIQRWQVYVGAAALLLALSGVIYQSGVLSQKVDQMAQQLSEYSASYVRKDVTDQEYKDLQDQLIDLKEKLSEDTAILNQLLQRQQR